jgi:hypothetical protein
MWASYFEIMSMGANPAFSATMAARQRKKGGGSPASVARVRRIAIIAVPPARMLDIVGPAEVFTDANKVRVRGPAYEVEIIAAAEDRTVPSQIGLPILAHRTYRELHGPIDTLLVGGGEWPPDKRHPPDFLSWLREQKHKGPSFVVRLHWLPCSGRCWFAEWKASNHPLELVQ